MTSEQVDATYKLMQTFFKLKNKNKYSISYETCDQEIYKQSGRYGTYWISVWDTEKGVRIHKLEGLLENQIGKLDDESV